jgi:hypothetical protein
MAEPLLLSAARSSLAGFQPVRIYDVPGRKNSDSVVRFFATNCRSSPLVHSLLISHEGLARPFLLLTGQYCVDDAMILCIWPSGSSASKLALEKAPGCSVPVIGQSRNLSAADEGVASGFSGVALRGSSCGEGEEAAVHGD